MKRGKIVTFICVFLLAVSCFIWSNIVGNLPVLLPHSISYYKFLRAVKAFLMLLPAVLCTAFLIDFSIYFGRNPGEAFERFSYEMLGKYKAVIIVSMIYVLLLSLSNLVFLPNVSKSLAYIERQPDNFSLYYEMALQNKEEGKDDIAYRYMLMAAQLNPLDADIQALKTKYEIESEHIVKSVKKEDYSFVERNIPQDEEIASPSNCFDMVCKAKQAFAEGRWLDAHYFARMAIRLSEPKDISVADAEKISFEAWKKLSEVENSGDKELAALFEKKMEGYNAFIRGDYLASYYVFNELKKMQRTPDPDVERYFKLAQKNLEGQYFFNDEYKDMQKYETLSNLYFAIKHKDKSSEVYFARGVTNLRKQGNLVRFLRDFSITYFDAKGNFVKMISVPYAKMYSVPVDMISTEQKVAYRLIEMPDLSTSVKFIPYIQLASVNRENNEGIAKPEYDYAASALKDKGSKAAETNYIFVPMSFDDFNSIAEASSGTENMDLFSLLSFMNVASKYGYSTEVFSIILQEKLLYPLSLLILLLLFANMSWNYRIGEETIFKFKWIFFVPFFVPIVYLFIQATFYIVRLLCLVVTYLGGTRWALFLAVAFEVILFTLLSVLFLSRKY